jgi:hypothetical protein
VETAASQLYDRVRTRSKEKYTNKLGKETKLGQLGEKVFSKWIDETDASWEGKIASKAGKVGIGISKALGKLPTSSRKNYLSARYESAALTEALADTEVFAQTQGAEIARIIAESGIDAKLVGKKVIGSFLEHAEDLLTPYGKEIALAYNEAATNLARIPYEWQIADATSQQYKKYTQALEAFDVQKNRMLPVLAQAKEGGRQSALAATATAETAIKLLSFLSSNPDASAKLRRLGTKNALVRSVQDTVTERGTQVLAGSIARRGLGRLVGFIAAPITGSVSAYYAGKRRAKESLRDADALARRGNVQTGELAKRMSSADRKIYQLGKLSQQLEFETDPEKRQAILSQLRTNTDFIETKLALGTIDFGKEEGRLTRQSTLISKLHEARVAIAVELQGETLDNLFEHANVSGLDARAREMIKTIGARNDARVASARNAMIDTRARTAAKWGAVMGTIGAAVSEYLHHTPDTAHSTHVDPLAHPAEQVLSKNKTALGHGPHIETTPGSLTVHNSAAEVVFSSKGAGQTLLDFRNSAAFKALSPETQKVFQGNIWEVTKKLQEYLPNAKDGKESILAGKGSHFGVTKDGVVYLADTGTKKMHVLGTIEHGTWHAHTDKTLRYIDAEHTARGAESAQHTASPKTQEETFEFDTSPNAQEQAFEFATEGNAQEWVQLHTADTTAPAHTLREEIYHAYDANNHPPLSLHDTRTLNDIAHGEPFRGSRFSPEDLAIIERESNRHFVESVDEWFGIYNHSHRKLKVSGFESPDWNAVKNMNARTLLATKASEVTHPQIRAMLKDIQNSLVYNDPTPPPQDMNVEDYLKHLFRKEMERHDW